MVISNRVKNQHLLWRAAFGPMTENAASLDTITPKKLWKLLLQTAEDDPVKIEVAKNIAEEYFGEVNNMADLKRKELTKEQRKEIQQQSREDLKNINIRFNISKHIYSIILL